MAPAMHSATSWSALRDSIVHVLPTSQATADVLLQTAAAAMKALSGTDIFDIKLGLLGRVVAVLEQRFGQWYRLHKLVRLILERCSLI